MPNTPNNAYQEHKQVRLTETTQFFDIDGIADKTSPLPHTMPDVKKFTECMRQLRVRRTDNIVCYDAAGFFTSGRAHWMMRYFGAEHVRILNGGLRKWIIEGRPLFKGEYVDGKGLPEEGDYNYEVVNPKMAVLDIKDVHKTAYYITQKATDV
jgi:thiosulfate/3-mercaptopyruvate sulfurtransferase